MFRQGEENHSRDRRGCTFNGAEWDALGSVLLRSVVARRGYVGHVTAMQFLPRLCKPRPVLAMLGNHTRAGTVPDRRGRCGMNQVMVCQDAVCFVPARPRGLRHLTTLVQERSRIDAGGVGWIMVWRAIARSVMAMQVAACSVRARSVLVITTTRPARFWLRRQMVGCGLERRVPARLGKPCWGMASLGLDFLCLRWVV